MGEKKRKAATTPFGVSVSKKQPIAITVLAGFNPVMRKYEIQLLMGGFETESEKDEAVRDLVDILEDKFGSEPAKMVPLV